MRAASNLRSAAKLARRAALWFGIFSLLAATLGAQCSNPTQVPDQTISSGTASYSGTALSATNVTINGSASVTFSAINCIQLNPGFHATAGTAGTTFHAWVESAPSAVSFSPSGGSGLSQQFTLTGSSPSGYGNLSEIYGLFNTSVSGVNACYIRYNRASNLLYLADNSGANWVGGFAPGSAGNASNSSCAINGGGSSFSAAGTQLAVTIAVTFQTAFSGVKNEYLNVYDNQGLNSTWRPMGTWTVPAPQQYYLTTAVSPAGGGTILPAGGWYNSGAVAWVSAAANQGYQFSGFSGDLTGTTTPQPLTMDGPKSVTANFTAQPAVTQTVQTSPAGLSYSVDGVTYSSPHQFQWVPQSAHTIAATSPQDGPSGTRYVFSSWSDNGAMSHTVAAPPSPGTYTANFGTQYYLQLPASTATVAAGNSTVFILRTASPGPPSMPAFTCSCPSGITATFFRTNAVRNDIYGMTVYVAGGVSAGARNLTISSTDASVVPAGVTVNVLTEGGLAPHTQLEINMGALYFAAKDDNGGSNHTWYTDQRDSARYPAIWNNCSTWVSGIKPVRSCIQEIMAKYRAQGITGVRFMFALHDALEIPLGNEAGATVRQPWLSEVQAFFQDLHDNAIYDITPTPDWESALPPVHSPGVQADGDRYHVAAGVAGAGEVCTNYPVSKNFRFSPTSPYAMRCYAEPCDSDHYGDISDIDRGSERQPDLSVPVLNWSYQCSPANPIFVGWDKLYAAIGALLGAAGEHGLTVREFDAQNEIMLEAFPVRGRLIVDNTRGDEDVLGGLRGLMEQTFGAGAGARVTYSAPSSLTSRPQFDCASLYGDSGRMHGASQLLGAFGGSFGAYDHPEALGLTCMLSQDEIDSTELTEEEKQQRILERTNDILNNQDFPHQLVTLPILHSLPSILDVHTAPCVLVDGDCDPVPNRQNRVVDEAIIQFSAMQALMASFGTGGWRCCANEEFADAVAMLGETHGHTAPGCPANNGGDWQPSAVGYAASGFNQSTLASRTPPTGQVNVVFRPWEYLVHQNLDPSIPVACNPISVNPPLTPRQ